MSKFATQRGFTLLELVVAITLAALASVAGAGILRLSVDYYDRARHYLKQQEQLRSALRIMGTELGGFAAGPGSLSGNAEAIEFATSSPPLGLAKVGTRRVKLACASGTTPRIILMHQFLPEKAPGADAGRAGYSATRPPASDNSGPTPTPQSPDQEPEALIDDLSGCAFSFLLRDEKAGAKTAAWVDSLPEHSASPLALRLSLATEHGAIPPVVFKLGR